MKDLGEHDLSISGFEMWVFGLQFLKLMKE
jgi:hypothetical protein